MPNYVVQVFGNFNSFQEKTTEVAYPTSIIGQYGLTGTVSISRQFEQHPSADIELVVDSSAIAQARTTFKQGTLIDMYSIGFRVSSYSEVAESTTYYPDGYYRISVSLEGKYVLPLEETIFLRRDTFNFFTTNISCNAVTPGTFINNPTTVALNTLATRSGLSYNGYNFTIKIPRDTAMDTTTSFSSELSSRVRIPGHFIFYSNATALTTKNFGSTAVWTLGANDIIGSLNISKRIKTLAYRAVQIEIPPLVTIIPPKQGTSVITTVVDDPENAATPPVGYTNVKTTDINFDVSGTVKVKKETTYENGTVIKEVVTKYGFAFISIDAFNIASSIPSVTFIPNNAAIWWKEIEKITTVYTYHSPTGYLLKVTSTGYKLGRFEQEPPPNSTLWEYSQDVNDAILIDLYRFKPIPYFSETTYELHQFRDYYKDVPSPFSNIEIMCDLNGNPIAVPQLDPDYVEPFFVAKSQTITSCFAHTTLAANFIDYFGDSGIKTTGEEHRTYSEIKITPSSNTVNSPYAFSPGKVEDMYTEFNHTFTSQDPGFKSVTEKIDQSNNQGRPPQATRKNPTPMTAEVNLTPPASRYVLTTQGQSPYQPSTGSLSYPDATLAESIAAAKTDLEIRDTQENETYSFSTFYNPQMAEGDKINFYYNNQVYTGTILSANSALDIQGELVGNTTPQCLGITNLTVGKTSNIATTVTSTQLPNPVVNPSSIPIAPGNIIYLGVVLGGITGTTIIGRGNF